MTLAISRPADSNPIEGEDILHQDRISTLWVPVLQEEGKQYSLLVVLHGYIHTSRRDYFSAYLGLPAYVKDLDHYLLEVYGTKNPEERHMCA